MLVAPGKDALGFLPDLSRPRTRLRAAMTDRPPRKTLWVSKSAHDAVASMQRRLRKRFGYRVTQSEAVTKGMEALEREIEAGK